MKKPPETKETILARIASLKSSILPSTPVADRAYKLQSIRMEVRKLERLNEMTF